MSETKNKDDNEHEIYSVSYTKAGLADKNSSSDDENEDRDQSEAGEQTPKISKEKSTNRDHERPIH